MNQNRCVCCSVLIPEGRQVCWNCENFLPGASVNKQRGIAAFVQKCLKKIFGKNSK